MGNYEAMIDDCLCEVKISKYKNGGVCIVLITEEDFMPFAEATLDIKGLKENEVAIADFDGKDSILRGLVGAEIVKKPHRYIGDEEDSIPICKLRGTYIK